jgi:hypothetical protein
MATIETNEVHVEENARQHTHRVMCAVKEVVDHRMSIRGAAKVDVFFQISVVFAC